MLESTKGGQMMKRLRLVLSMFLALFLAGCISVETTIKLNRDGSGQIVEKIGMGKGFADMASAMSSGGEDGQASKPFSKEQFEKEARDFGQGVRFVSMSESEDESMKYYEAVYAFDDINKVGVDQNQGNRASTQNTLGGSKKKEPVTFKFSAGEDYSTLKIQLPETPKDDSGEDESDKDTPQQEQVSPEMEEAGLQMMKAMLKGMHFAVKIDFNGEIVETDATNVDGNTVTLLDINFDSILGNAEKLQALNVRQPEGIEEVKEILKDVEGLKFELQEEIAVRFE
jgi:hypothetical protein